MAAAVSVISRKPKSKEGENLYQKSFYAGVLYVPFGDPAAGPLR